MCGFGGPDVGLIQVESSGVAGGGMGLLDFARADLEAFLKVVKSFARLGREVSEDVSVGPLLVYMGRLPAYPRYVFSLPLTNDFFPNFIFSSVGKVKNCLERPKTSSWVNDSGRLVRYAKPEVAKALEICCARAWISGSLELSIRFLSLKAPTSMTGREVKEVAILMVPSFDCCLEKVVVCSVAALGSTLNSGLNDRCGSAHGFLQEAPEAKDKGTCRS
jgi:hypothetical protein